MLSRRKVVIIMFPRVLGQSRRVKIRTVPSFNPGVLDQGAKALIGCRVPSQLKSEGLDRVSQFRDLDLRDLNLALPAYTDNLVPDYPGQKSEQNKHNNQLK